jgi:hypothetical protein
VSQIHINLSELHCYFLSYHEKRFCNRTFTIKSGLTPHWIFFFKRSPSLFSSIKSFIVTERSQSRVVLLQIGRFPNRLHTHHNSHKFLSLLRVVCRLYYRRRIRRHSSKCIFLFRGNVRQGHEVKKKYDRVYKSTLLSNLATRSYVQNIELAVSKHVPGISFAYSFSCHFYIFHSLCDVIL